MPRPTKINSSTEIFPDGLAIAQAIDRASVTGYAFVARAVSPEAVRSLEDEYTMIGLEWAADQMQDRPLLPVGDKVAPAATYVTHALGVRVRQHRFKHPKLASWYPEFIDYQELPHLGMRQAQEQFAELPNNLEASITIRGVAALRVEQRRFRNRYLGRSRLLDSCVAGPGTLTLLCPDVLDEDEKSKITYRAKALRTEDRLVLNLQA